MAIDYQKTARELVKELGGNDNISNVTHCATRLRFILKDESIVNKERVAKIQEQHTPRAVYTGEGIGKSRTDK